MYSAHHAAVGVGITVAGYSVAGTVGAIAAAPIAFASHYLVDAFGEAAYGSSFPPSKQTLFWEGGPFLAFLIGAYISGVSWVFALGWFAGMFMDLYDKGRYVLFGEFGRTFHPAWRKPRWQMSLAQTKTLAVLAALSFIVMGAAL